MARRGVVDAIWLAWRDPRAALVACLAVPVTLGLAVAGVAAELVWLRLLPLVSVLGYAGLAFWLWLAAAGLAEAEGSAATGPIVVA